MQLALLGASTASSLSPKMHRAALAHLGVQGDYQPLSCPEEHQARAVVAALRAGRWQGLNVTLPYKELAYRLCDVLHPDAQLLGAVNTLFVREGALWGYNTDYPGLRSAVAALLGETAVAGGKACILGAGGAAVSAVMSAVSLGFTEVVVHNRTAARAEALVQRVGVGQFVADRAEALTGARLVLQATSLGMGAVGASFEGLKAEAMDGLRLAPDAAVLDLVYATSETHSTPWVEAAWALGLMAEDGLGMLVNQAALALELWLGRRERLGSDAVPAAELTRVMRQAARAEAI